MNLVGKKVIHKFKGAGVVISQSEKIVEVQFSTGIANLQYPQSFEKYCQFEDVETQNFVSEQIPEAKKIEAEAQKNSARKVKSVEDWVLESKLGTEYLSAFLARKPILTYKDVESRFGISISKYGKGINPTDTAVVLISSMDELNGKYVYHDKWTEDGDYIYSGEGKIGNQSMTKGNLAIKNASRNNKKIHLFVKFSPQEYYYQGEFKLVDYAYEDDKDETGSLRKEYKFRLRRVEI